jgi:hypothetical protein
LKPETKHYALTLSYATKNVKVLKNSMGSHVPTFGHDIVVMASGTRAHERCTLSRDIATGASKLVAALLVARFADGRTATLTYSQESAALLTVEELSAGVYIHFDAIAMMSAENDDASRQYRLCGWRRCRRCHRYRRPKLRSGRRDCIRVSVAVEQDDPWPGLRDIFKGRQLPTARA